MSKLIIEFQHSGNVQDPRPWPVAVDEHGVVTSGLGPDDGAILMGFGPAGQQRVTVFPVALQDGMQAVAGLTASFVGNDGNMFEWDIPIRAVTVVAS